ncbi:MAG: lipopolysaccharide transport system ATP-binding protein [Candidatus Azotimanducaceae bacterium]
MQSFVRSKFKFYREHIALEDVSLSVRRGETVGIIGGNGAGKSTLLQILCGTTSLSEGKVRVNGKIAALLELGAGFNPEFTGYENIYLYATVLGYPKSKVDDFLDEILEFAQIGDYISEPVKTYSSGMFMRLAFSISIFLAPDILVVDEALSVGDVFFQAKCRKKLAEYQESGGTLLLVTHSTDTLISMCDRSIVIDHGRVVFDGDSNKAVDAYLKIIFGNNSAVSEDGLLLDAIDRFGSRTGYNPDETRLGVGGCQVSDFDYCGVQNSVPKASFGEHVFFDVKYVFGEPLEDVVFGITINTESGVLAYAMNTFYQRGTAQNIADKEIVNVRFSIECNLTPGTYFVGFGASRIDMETTEFVALDRRLNSIVFTVRNRGRHSDGIADLNANIEMENTSIV